MKAERHLRVVASQERDDPLHDLSVGGLGDDAAAGTAAEAEVVVGAAPERTAVDAGAQAQYPIDHVDNFSREEPVAERSEDLQRVERRLLDRAAGRVRIAGKDEVTEVREFSLLDIVPGKLALDKRVLQEQSDEFGLRLSRFDPARPIFNIGVQPCDRCTSSANRALLTSRNS